MKKILACLCVYLVPLSAFAMGPKGGAGGGLSPGASETVGSLTVNGDSTLGSGTEDAITLNADAVTFANDTAVTLTGGLNGINFDANTLSIDAAQNFVGVQNAAPDSPLTGGSGSGDGYMNITAAAGNNKTLYFGTIASPKAQINSAATSGNLNIRTDANAPIIFKLNGDNEQMRITASGDVGINNAAPAYLLHVSSGVLTIDGANSGANIKGVVDGSTSSAGNWGEYLSSATAGAVNTGATGVYGDLASIALTAGDWNVNGMVQTTNNGATATAMAAGISSTSGNSTTGLTQGTNWLSQTGPLSTTDVSATIANYRVNITATTTYYLKYMAAFSAGQPQAYGSLTARRIR